jgi:citrate synthase
VTDKKLASAIADVHPDRIIVRGEDLCRDLIGRIGFTEYFLLLLTGERPSAKLLAAADACLVAIAEHGFVPSIQAARMTLAGAPEAVQGAVAAGLLGAGTVVLGAAEVAGRLLADVAAEGARRGDLAAAAQEAVMRLRAARAPLPGFGHPTHKAGDPRAARLLVVADELGVSGAHVAALREVEAAVEPVYGRKLPTNVSAAIPALLLDAGYPVAALKGIPLLARCASLIAHLHEEAERKLGFRLADIAEHAVAYDGRPEAKPA